MRHETPSRPASIAVFRARGRRRGEWSAGRPRRAGLSLLAAKFGGAAVGDGLVERARTLFWRRCPGIRRAGGHRDGAGVRERDRELLEHGVADSASNATVASETGTGSATVLVSAGSGRWQVQSHVTSCAATVQSHVTSCAATVYYSYLGVASSATAYSTVHAKTVEERDGGDADPQSTTSVTGARELGALGVGYSGDNVAPTYGPLEVSCSGAGVTRTGSLASGTITAGRRAPT
eukprot:tig00021723_g23237.t1